MSFSRMAFSMRFTPVSLPQTTRKSTSATQLPAETTTAPEGAALWQTGDPASYDPLYSHTLYVTTAPSKVGTTIEDKHMAFCVGPHLPWLEDQELPYQ